MLTAKLENGQIIVLTKEMQKPGYLLELRKKESFYCPVCAERLILKIGRKRISHFSHGKGSNCKEQHDTESENHLNGKLQLYGWLKEQGLRPVLEQYFPEIKQRADLIFQYEGKMYAIEYQCSQIDVEIFRRRTKGYQKLKIFPIWILGSPPPTWHSSRKNSISDFHYLFLRKNQHHHFFLPAYCSMKKQFLFLHHLFPISVRNCFSQNVIKPLNQMDITYLLEPIFSTEVQLNNWRKELETFKIQLLMFRAHEREKFIRELYASRLHPLYLPPFVGIPLKHNIVFHSPPFIWQGYVFLDHFFGRKKGTVLSFIKILKSVKRRIYFNEIKIRQIPNIDQNLLPFAIKEYIFFLEKWGILRRVSNHQYILLQNIEIVRNLEMVKREEEKFFLHWTLNEFHMIDINYKKM